MFALCVFNKLCVVYRRVEPVVAQLVDHTLGD